MILPTQNIRRVGNPNDEDYFILNGDEGNIAAVRWSRYNVVRIGPQGEGGPAPGGVITGDPEDVRWFANNLLELADRMEAHK